MASPVLTHRRGLGITFAGVPAFNLHLMLVEIRCVSLVAVSFFLEMGLLVTFHKVIDDRLHCCGSLLRSLSGNHARVARDHWLSDLSEVFGIAALDALESLELRS